VPIGFIPAVPAPFAKERDCGLDASHEFGRFPWSDILGPWGVVMTLGDGRYTIGLNLNRRQAKLIAFAAIGYSVA
jgi:hypothetical protein